MSLSPTNPPTHQPQLGPSSHGMVHVRVPVDAAADLWPVSPLRLAALYSVSALTLSVWLLHRCIAASQWGPVSAANQQDDGLWDRPEWDGTAGFDSGLAGLQSVEYVDAHATVRDVHSQSMALAHGA